MRADMQKLAILLSVILLSGGSYPKPVFPEAAPNEIREALQPAPASTLRQDCALVTHFMAYNGGMVLKYENAVEIRKSADYVLANTTNLAARGEAALAGKDALDDINALKPKMVHVPVSPENWTVADLKKLKNDPKSREVFAALVRVRNAIYDPALDADLRKELASMLLDRIPGRRTDALKGLLDRVQMVGEGSLQAPKPAKPERTQ